MSKACSGEILVERVAIIVEQLAELLADAAGDDCLPDDHDMGEDPACVRDWLHGVLVGGGVYASRVRARMEIDGISGVLLNDARACLGVCIVRMADGTEVWALRQDVS